MGWVADGRWPDTWAGWLLATSQAGRQEGWREGCRERWRDAGREGGMEGCRGCTALARLRSPPAVSSWTGSVFLHQPLTPRKSHRPCNGSVRMGHSTESAGIREDATPGEMSLCFPLLKGFFPQGCLSPPSRDLPNTSPRASTLHPALVLQFSSFPQKSPAWQGFSCLLTRDTQHPPAPSLPASRYWTEQGLAPLPVPV